MNSARTFTHQGCTVYAVRFPVGSVWKVTLNRDYPNIGCEFLRELPYNVADEAVTQAVRNFLRQGGLAKLRAAEKRWHELLATSARVDAELREREAAEHARMKAKGHTLKLEAWVHPASGDDYAVVEYGQAFPPAYVQRMLRMEGSSVLTDYRVSKL